MAEEMTDVTSAKSARRPLHRWARRRGSTPRPGTDTDAGVLGPETSEPVVDTAELPLALRQLLGRRTIQSLPAHSVTGRPTGGSAPVEGMLEETVMRLRDPSGGVITVRRADRGDLTAARAMHDRCSAHTLGLRYHGPVRDADRYLDHLLSPRFGRTLAAQTASGRLVALGHLLWDGDETEVALLVEDDWQRRGIGSKLLGRLVAMAVETGCESVYAVTQAHNTGMVAAMRGLSLPLDHRIEEGILVITARPAASRARTLQHGPHGPHEQHGPHGPQGQRAGQAG